MLFRRSDLPLARDESSRLMPWVIALMVYLAALALAGAMSVNAAVSHWNQGLTGTLTIQVPAAEGATATRRQTEREWVEAVVGLLDNTPGVLGATPLADRQVAALIEPWLGPEAMADLPLPRLIDVALAPGSQVNLANLAKRLDAAVPGTTVDDHRKWVRDLLAVARTVELVVLAIVILIGGAAGLAIIFATRSGLAIHRNVIEVLHLIGAHDNYIARQFQNHSMLLGLRGGIAGVILAAATLFALRYSSVPEHVVLPDLTLLPWHWAVLAALPFATALLAMITARRTVLRRLARML